MIDWVNAQLPLKHKPFDSGSILSISPNGEIEWETRKRIKITGSYESSIQIRSEGGDGTGNATHIEFRGNPSKFLQGHNVFGSDDLIGLMTATYLKILKFLDFPINLNEYKNVQMGFYTISKIDINYMYNLKSRADVLAWIRAAESSSLTRHGRPTTKGGTLYWGKHSRRWAIKAYSKGEELIKHPLPAELNNHPIEKWADNKLRLELVLLSKELKQTLNIKHAYQLTPEKINALYYEYIKRIEMKNKLTLTNDELKKLPSKLQATYLLWKEGYDCRLTLSRSTYSRHRKELKAFGINLDLEPNSQKELQTNVIPLVRILEAEPAPVPSWAYENDLIFQAKSA